MKSRDYQFQPNQYVASYRTSGLSRRSFARVAGVPESTLREWEKRAPSKSLLPKATAKSAKAKAETNDLYTAVMFEIDSSLDSLKRLKKILTNL